MRYFKLIVYVEGGDYETRETLIDEPTFRQYQKAILDKSTHLVLEDRVLKVGSIKEILPADEIVKEYLAQGITLKQLGFKERPKLEAEKTSNFAKQLSEKKKMLSDEDRSSIQEETSRP